MNNFNRFDMEQQIMTCWSVCEDLNTLMEGIQEYNMDQDRISNALLGMKELYQLKFEKLWSQFEMMCKEYPTKSPVKQYESQRTDWPFGEPKP